MSLPEQSMEELKILLVEDSFESMNLIRQMLKDLGVNQVFTAKDGVEALDLLGMFSEEGEIDLVLCDWNMPRMTGVEVLRQIRSCDPDMPFLMITGLADVNSVTEAKSLGVTGYIRKPFSLDELEKKLGLVRRIINHRRKQQVAV